MSEKTQQQPGGALSKVGWLRRWLRKVLAPVPPWDFDELPVRHWWDVYAK